jgi:hypothetical protein
MLEDLNQSRRRVGGDILTARVWCARENRQLSTDESSTMNQSQDPLMEAAVKAATDVGAVYPDAVAEILREHLYSAQRGATTYVYCNSREGTLPIEAAVAKLREMPRLSRLFSPDGKLDLKEISQPEYLAIRKTHPELFGLR